MVVFSLYSDFLGSDETGSDLTPPSEPPALLFPSEVQRKTEPNDIKAFLLLAVC